MYLLVLTRDSWYLDRRILDRALLRCTVRWYRYGAHFPIGLDSISDIANGSDKKWSAVTVGGGNPCGRLVA